MMHWQGLTELTSENYTPLALMNEDPAGVQVRSDAGYDTLADLLDAIKAGEPGAMSASGTGQGGIWHLAIAGLLNDSGDRSGQGSVGAERGRGPGPAGPRGRRRRHRALLARRGACADRGRPREVAGDHVARARRSLPRRAHPAGSGGLDWAIGAWRGIVGPAGLPEDVTARLIEALEAVFNSDEYKEFMLGRGFGIRWASGDDFAAFMAESNQALGDTMRAVGLAH